MEPHREEGTREGGVPLFRSNQGCSFDEACSGGEWYWSSSLRAFFYGRQHAASLPRQANKAEETGEGRFKHGMATLRASAMRTCGIENGGCNGGCSGGRSGGSSAKTRGTHA